MPDVVGEFSSRRVLTTELAEGARFSEVVDWPDEERQLAAETLYRFAFGSVYGLAAFNGDPHPGNYIFRPVARSPSSTSDCASGSPRRKSTTSPR